MKLLSSKKGFTIIEVVIVLAIAGLIFAIVFWALPNLQKNQRDNTRRTIASNIMANLEQHAANANGVYPSNVATFGVFIDTFYACSFTANGQLLTGANCKLVDPLGAFTVSFGTPAQVGTITSQSVSGTMKVANEAGCNVATPGQFTTLTGQTRAFALMIKLENGIAYCISNTN